MGGLGISNPVNVAKKELNNSLRLTANLTDNTCFIMGLECF